MLKAGMRLKSAVCNAEFMVIKTPPGESVLCCGGQKLLDAKDTRDPTANPSPDFSGGSLVGKRYIDQNDGIELLCTKAGQGSLSLAGQAMAVKQAKVLPSSD